MKLEILKYFVKIQKVYMSNIKMSLLVFIFVNFFMTLKYCFVTEKSPMCQFRIETLHVETHSENSTVQTTASR